MSEASSLLRVKPDGIPPVLRMLWRWVLWVAIVRDGRSTKVPYGIDRVPVSVTDSASLLPFEDALDAYQRGGFDGIGYVFVTGDDRCGLDLDGCRNPVTGEIAPWAIEIIKRFGSAAYVEISPSGTGLKLFVRGKSPFASGKKVKLVDQPSMGGKTAAIEIYDHGRYFAVTGHQLDGYAGLENCQEAIDWLAETYWPARPEPQRTATHERASDGGNGQSRCDKIERARRYLATVKPAISGAGGHDTTFRAACALVKGFGLTVDEAFALLAEYNLRCEPPWSERELMHKLEDAARQPGPTGYLLNAGDGGSCADDGAMDFNSVINEFPTDEPPRGDGGAGDSAGTKGADQQEGATQRVGFGLPAPEAASAMFAMYLVLRKYVIEGLLRMGETANIVSASKVGKSWWVYGVILSVAMGLRLFDRYQCRQGRVLLIDGELHRETLIHRLCKVAAAMGIGDDWMERVDIWCLRGQRADLRLIGDRIRRMPPDQYTLVVLDALYRFFPPGVKENDNADITGLFNLIDEYASHLNSGWLNVHHSSKGFQGDKSVVDVGSGAGAQARATDCHIILRPHEDDGVAVMQAAVRSWAPVEPLAIRYEFPLWRVAPSVDPRRLQEPAAAARRQKADQTLQEDRAAVIEVVKQHGKPNTKNFFKTLVPFGDTRFQKAFNSLLLDGTVVGEDVKGHRKQVYQGWRLRDPAMDFCPPEDG